MGKCLLESATLSLLVAECLNLRNRSDASDTKYNFGPHSAKACTYLSQKGFPVSSTVCSQRTPISPISAAQFVEPPYLVIHSGAKCLARVAEQCISEFPLTKGSVVGELYEAAIEAFSCLAGWVIGRI